MIEVNHVTKEFVSPKILYLDEPTIGLDIVVKDKIRDAIREINEKYQTTVHCLILRIHMVPVRV